MHIFSRFLLGDTVVHYVTEENDGPVGLRLLPTSMEKDIVPHRQDLSAMPEAKPFLNWGAYPVAAQVEPLVQVCVRYDKRAAGFTPGQSMRNTTTSGAFRLVGQTCDDSDKEVRICTELCAPNGLSAKHVLAWEKSTNFLSCHSELENTSLERITLEMVSSFTLGFITPFAETDASDRLSVHRFRSSWSSEGRHARQTLEELELERSWANHEQKCERFGQVGSNPVRRWFPFAAVEDSVAGVMWGVQLEASGSWQLELYRKDDFLHLSGGLADYETGHWFKHLEKGDYFVSPAAYIATVKGGLEDICGRLLAAQDETGREVPPSERDLPVVFNEWCTSWGKPAHDSLIRTAQAISSLGIKYLVIDAGWYAGKSGVWANSQGDWEASPMLFPQGLRKTCAEIRARGLIPGLWFEFEVAGETSSIWEKQDWFLTLDGGTLQAGTRRFFDFRQPEVRDYLRDRMTRLLLDCGIGYLKIDYNEPIGIGCDGAESPGEGLRQHLEEVKNFIASLRQTVPGLVIENSSSGGHRAEPSFISLTDMTAFSDSHETKEIPVIAANLNKLVSARKLQIWVVLHPIDDDKRLYYSLAASFLGRMCLSGEIAELSPHQHELVRGAAGYYRELIDIIVRGPGQRVENRNDNHRYPEGWQALLKTSADCSRLLVVFHAFAGTDRLPVQIKLPAGNWRLVSAFCDKSETPALVDGVLTFPDAREFSGAVALLQKE